MSNNIGMRAKLLRKLIEVHNWTIDIFALFAEILVFFMLVIVNLEVVLRYFVGRPTEWVVETSELCLFGLPFLAAAWVLRSEGHVKADLILNRLRPERQSMVIAFTSFLCVIVCLITTWYGAKLTWEFFQVDYRTPGNLRFPKFLIVVIIPMGMLVLAIQFLGRGCSHWRKWRTMVTAKEKLGRTTV